MRRLAVVVFGAAWLSAVASAAEQDAEALELFEKKIRPVLVSQCYECHSSQAKKLEGNLSLETREGMLKGGDLGAAVVPGDPAKSLLLQAVGWKDVDLQMPPKTPLAKEVVADFESWIKRGAPDPRVGPSTAPASKYVVNIDEARQRWPFTPIAAPPIPRTRTNAWPKSPIDHFVLEKLEARGLSPVGDADKRTLIRRATFDLTGLPPSIAEIDAFLADQSPEAFAKVVDRLLASRAYGERWGRHWLDVARYADTAGDNSDYPVPQMYRYRNWVIDAFNADMPYDQFIREQLAGDLLPAANDAERQQHLIATGYIANARRFGSRVDDYPQHLTIEDTIDNLGRAFLGLSVNCARCHNHKFDPITTNDYYALYGIFQSTRYPWPGIELDKKQRDFVPLPGVSPSEADPYANAYAVVDGKVGDAKVQLKGEPERQGEVVKRRMPEVFGGTPLPADESGSGRKQLAEWLASAENPLTARVIVNRLWHYHFGKGLVATPNDFGRQGKPPTHPELLDYLATQLVANKWSLKALHRHIMLSRTYQLASTDDAKALEVDPSNELLWRYNRRRLDAEAIRDSMLTLSGNLDSTPANTPHPFPPMSKWDFTQHKPFKDVYPTNRRSVYLMTQRIQRHPYLAIFDGADTGASTGYRITSTTTLQSLYLLNDEFVHEQAQKLAARLIATHNTDESRLHVAYQLCFARPAEEQEQTLAGMYLAKAREAATGSADQRTAEAWTSLSRVLLRTNEFVYVD